MMLEAMASPRTLGFLIDSVIRLSVVLYDGGSSCCWLVDDAVKGKGDRHQKRKDWIWISNFLIWRSIDVTKAIRSYGPILFP
jgi:hypothetical protein